MKIGFPAIMGILNVTPDSFSDGGRFLNHDAALSHAMRLISEGADIIDVGGESSRPGSFPVSEEEEIRRVIPVIKSIRKKTDILISIDTTKSSVAREALDAGADMINDTSAGTFDPDILSVVADHGALIALMHMRGKPKTMQTGEIHYDDVTGEIKSYLDDHIKEAERAGVKRDKIIIDPGIGFGKLPEHNLTIIKELGRLKSLGCPILIGTSRKSFIGHILGGVEPHERLEGSLATIGISYINGANIFRVHDVSATRRFLKVFSLISPT